MPHAYCPVVPGFSPSPVPTSVSPGAHSTVMFLLSQDRTSWISNCGVFKHNKTWCLLRTC